MRIRAWVCGKCLHEFHLSRPLNDIVCPKCEHKLKGMAELVEMLRVRKIEAHEKLELERDF